MIIEKSYKMSKSIDAPKTGLIGGICSFAAVYMASSAPIPLYSAYRELIGLSNADLSLSSVLYFIGTVISLLFLARLSDHCGRRKIIIASLCLAMAGCLMFLTLNQAAVFLIARFVQGLSCGLGSSCMSAYVVDLCSGKKATIATSSAPMIGLALGSFGSGAFAQYSKGSLSHIFVVVLIILILCIFLICTGEESVAKKDGAISSLKPEIRMPHNIRKYLPAAGAVFVGTWAIGGFYQAFSSPMAVEQLHTANVMIAAAVFACLQAPNVIGSTISGKIKPEKAQRFGMLAFLISIIGVIISLNLGVVVSFLIFSALSGISWGLAYAASMQGILSKT